MNIAMVLDYWKKSLQLLAWQETRLTLLAALNNWLRSLKIIGHQAGVFLLGHFALVFFSAIIIGFGIPSWYKLLGSTSWINALLTLFLSHRVETATNIMVFAPWHLPLLVILGISTFILLFIYFLAARPSIEAKDVSYFKKYTTKFIGFCFFSALWLYIGSITFFMLLFFFDGGDSFRDVFYALYRGALFAWYFLPLVIIVLFALRCLTVLLVMPFELLAGAASSIICFFGVYVIFFLVTLFAISLSTMYYIKVKHTYYQLFFKV